MTKIEWTDASWNPVTGCTKIAAGCKNCYADAMAKRLAGRYGYPAENPFQVTIHKDKFELPLHWKQPRMIFVCSMGDLFHEAVRDVTIDLVFAIMALCSRHTFQILTKRPERMQEYLSKLSEANYDVAGRLADAADRYFTDGEAGCHVSNSINECLGKKHNTGWPLRNLLIGTSISTQEDADKNIPWLLKTPAFACFVSFEPALSIVDFTKWLYPFIDCPHFDLKNECCCRPENPSEKCKPGWCIFGKRSIDWIIMGSESGPKARDFDMAWARNVRDHCIAGEIPFFFKQGAINGKLVKMPALDGKIWNQMPKGI